MKVQVEFSGGLELIMKDRKKQVSLEFADKPSVSLKEVVAHVRDNVVKERPELFAEAGVVRPGILVLINDCDWEITGGIDSTVADKDVVVFISTLHGG